MDWASITQGRPGSFRTVASTDERAVALDEIQYELGSGPCVDAVLQDTVFHTDDLRADTRWPEYSRRATEETTVRSMLSFRMFFEVGDLIAGLNLYSTRAAAFDSDTAVIGTLITTHGAAAITAAAAREQVGHLGRALASNRDIGVAMGILMAQHKVTREQAFDLLRVASQHSNRKIVDISDEVIRTGALDLAALVLTKRPWPGPDHRPGTASAGVPARTPIPGRPPE